MDSIKLVKFLKKHFPKASFKMFLDKSQYIHYFPDIQFVDKKGQIIPPWNSKNPTFCFIEDIPFFTAPITKLLVWVYPKDTQLTVCVTIDGKKLRSMPIFLNAIPKHSRAILDKIDIPKHYEALPSYKEI